LFLSRIFHKSEDAPHEICFLLFFSLCLIFFVSIFPEVVFFHILIEHIFCVLPFLFHFCYIFDLSPFSC